MKKNKIPSSPPEHATPTVRERTLVHMKTLLRNSTKLGAGIALVCGVATQGCNTRHVVDPPPPPPPGVCENPNTLRLDYCVDHDARWEKSGRKWTIDLILRVGWGISNMDFEEITSTDIFASGASVKSIKMEHQKVEIILAPNMKVREAELKLAVRCNQQQLPFRVKLDLSKPRKKKGYIPAKVVR
jgi:hypothetical protein